MPGAQPHGRAGQGWRRGCLPRPRGPPPLPPAGGLSCVITSLPQICLTPPHCQAHPGSGSCPLAPSQTPACVQSEHGGLSPVLSGSLCRCSGPAGRPCALPLGKALCCVPRGHHGWHRPGLCPIGGGPRLVTKQGAGGRGAGSGAGAVEKVQLDLDKPLSGRTVQDGTWVEERMV